MRILYLTHSCPYPPNKGDRIRSFHLLRHLASRYEVILIYPSFSSSDVGHGEELQQYCHEVYRVELSPFFSRLQCLLELWNGGSLTIAYFHSKKIQQIIKGKDFELAIADCSSMAPYILELAQPKIVDFVDVDSEKWKIYAKNTSFPLSWVHHLESQRLGKFEKQIVNQVHACFVTSDQERQCLPSSEQVFVVPNGIDTGYFHPHRPACLPECLTLLFMGAMDYFANIDGVLFFHETILPLINLNFPGVKFIIAGMNPTQQILNLEGLNTVVTGFVPDMRVYLNEATVCVVPLRIARGVQNKVLEAMAMNVPVVSTSAANGGINARDGEEILIADSPTEFADAVGRLLIDPELRDVLSTRARDFVMRGFSWERSSEIVDTAIVHALQKKDSESSEHSQSDGKLTS